MSNHVHVLLRPVRAGLLSTFIQDWKTKTSFTIQDFLNLRDPKSVPFGKHVRDQEGNVHVWQPKSYAFNVYNMSKAVEKLEYMHSNPVRAGLVTDPCEYPWSAAAHF